MAAVAETQDERWNRVASPHYRKHFEQIPNKRSQRADLHAFARLDEWFPGNEDIVAAAAHDEIYLCFGEAEVEKLTDEQLIELSRCGVMYRNDGLFMFA